MFRQGVSIQTNQQKYAGTVWTMTSNSSDRTIMTVGSAGAMPPWSARRASVPGAPRRPSTRVVTPATGFKKSFPDGKEFVFGGKLTT